jgi:hypothetical protein
MDTNIWSADITAQSYSIRVSVGHAILENVWSITRIINITEWIQSNHVSTESLPYIRIITFVR